MNTQKDGLKANTQMIVLKRKQNNSPKANTQKDRPE